MDERATALPNGSPVEIYEAVFLPAMMNEWPPRLLAAAGVDSGHRVLDVGCGTGALARQAAERVGHGGRVVGVDPNERMLAVAARVAPGVEWRHGSAEALPFEDAAFDRVVSQFAVMFFADRAAAMREMARVLAPDGRCAVAAWSALAEAPGYERLAELIGRLAGERLAADFVAPWALGDAAELERLLDEAFVDVEVSRHDGTARFDSVEALVHAELRGWLPGAVDDDQYAAIVDAARVELVPFVDAGGRLAFPMPALVASGRRPD